MSGLRPSVTLISALTADASSRTGTASCVPPLGILSLAAVLKARGLNAEIIDLNSLWLTSRSSSKQLFTSAIAAVRASQPPMIGLSTICSTYPLTLRLAKTLKQDFPHTPIVLGGPQASLVDVATLKAFPFIDFVLRGEAEETFPMLVNVLLTEGSPTQQPGLTYRDRREVRRNPAAPPILHLDTLPLPSFDAYGDPSLWPSLPLEIGRGCPFTCRFCSTSSFFSRHFRLKSSHHVISQMQLLSGRFGVRAFDLIHDMFTVDRARVAEFCRHLRDLGAPYRWTCSARTDRVDNELLTTMHNAGCAAIFFGIETASPRLQRLIRKGLDLSHARAVLRKCDNLGIRTIASLIIGYPGETAGDLHSTLSFFVRTGRLNQADAQLHVLAPLANTSFEVEYRSRLTLDDLVTDLPEFGAAQGAADRRLVTRHPEVFGHFYAYPNRPRSAELCYISAFFVALRERCRGLLLALAESSSNPLDLYDEWARRPPSRKPSLDYYRRRKFLRDYLTFVAAFYVGKGRTAVDVMWRFYETLSSSRLFASTDTASSIATDSADALRRVRRLPCGVRLLSVRGDVVKVLECLKKGRKPGLDCLGRTTTVAVRYVENGRFLIEKLSPLATAILRCLDGTVDDIGRRLTNRGVRWAGRSPEEFVPEALRLLEADGLVTGVPAARASSGRGRRGVGAQPVARLDQVQTSAQCV